MTVFRFPVERCAGAPDPVESTRRFLAVNPTVRDHIAFNWWCHHVRGTRTVRDLDDWQGMAPDERASWTLQAMDALEAYWTTHATDHADR